MKGIKIMTNSNVRPETMQRINTPALAEAFIEEQLAALREQIGDKKVLLALTMACSARASPNRSSRSSARR